MPNLRNNSVRRRLAKQLRDRVDHQALADHRQRRRLQRWLDKHGAVVGAPIGGFESTRADWSTEK